MFDLVNQRNVNLMSGLIVAMQNTVIKTEAVEASSRLPRNKKFDLSRGQTLEVQWAEYDNKTAHWQFELSISRNGFTVWNAYAPHVRFVEDAPFFAAADQGSEANEVLAEA